MKKLENEYSTSDVMQIIGVKRERLREWTSQGFVKPKTKASGTGSKAIFGLLDLYKIAIFKRIVEAGVSRRMAAKWIDSNPVINNLQKLKDVNFVLLLINKEGGGSWISYFEPPWKLYEKDMIKKWEVGILINLKKINNDVQERLKEM